MPAADPPRLLFVGYYGSGNLGDELLLESAVGWARRALGPRVALSATGCRLPRHRLPDGVTPVDLHNGFAVAEAVRRADAVVLAGGGLFQDKGRARIWELLDSPCWSTAVYLRPILLAELYERPAFMFGSGVGPLDTAEGGRLARRAIRGCAQVSLRDEGSRRWLERIGAETGHVEVDADLGWLDPAPARTPRPGGPWLGVNLRKTIRAMPEGLVDEVAAALTRAHRELGLRLVYVPFQYGTELSDEALGEALQRRGAPIEVLPEPDRILDHAAAYPGLELSLGMRYHSALLAQRAGVPHVAIVYDEKVESLMTQLGQPDLALDPARLDADRLFAALERAWTDRAAIRETLEARGAALRARASAAGDRLQARLQTLESPRVEEDEALSARAEALAALFDAHGHRFAADIARQQEIRARGLEARLARTQAELADTQARLRRILDSPPGRLARRVLALGRRARGQLG